MCGINGILGTGFNSYEQLNAMNDAIIHRGPNADGTWISEDGYVAFGHRRLAILDLSFRGSQPMTSLSGKYTIVFNGEIYNYPELKRKMVSEFPGIGFRSTSDTELLINCIEKYGMDTALSLIKGMFAFAVYEKDTGNVYLARDRMGEKPLYYGRVAGKIVFSSDIGSIEKIQGFDNKINAKILSVYFKGGYIPAPYTIYEEIYKLEPGKMLTVKAPYTEWEEKTYWDITKVAYLGQQKPFEGSFEEASERLEELIRNSIKGQMLSDVPLGAFLSGGIDSTLTVALMQDISDTAVRTFTIGFDDPKYNEAEYAAESAKHLGTKHTQMYVTKEDLLGVVNDIPKAFTEPFADSSQIPTMLVSRLTKQHVTVSLSGDAGDEFFCGYNSYKDVQNGLKVLASKLSFIKGAPRKKLGEILYSIGSGNPTLHKVATVLGTDCGEDWYRSIREDDVLLNKLYKDKNQYPDNIATYPNGYLKGVEPNLMLMDMIEYLPDDILVKVDRAGMFYSLESRIPLLDRDVMEFAWTLPQEYKYDGVTTKKILKNILYKYVPKQMMDRPKKGFSVPLASWLAGPELKPWAESLIHDCRTLAIDYVDCCAVDKMWKDFLATGKGDRNIWNILMLLQWFENRK